MAYKVEVRIKRYNKGAHDLGLNYELPRIMT